jgi:hypothetical protein
MTKLCRLCGKPLIAIVTPDGRQLARQCPLCLAWAPGSEDVGLEPAAKKPLTKAEQKARKTIKVAKAALQLGWWFK